MSGNESVSLAQITEVQALIFRERQRVTYEANRHLADSLFNLSIRCLSAGDLAIDCGANVGRLTQIMANTGADVIAFEPDENLIHHLTKISDSWPNVIVRNAAVGIEEGTVELFRSPNYDNNVFRESVKNTTVPNTGLASQTDGTRDLDGVNTSDNSTTVELVNIIEVLKENIAKRGRIALLKIDIEGAELDVLEKMIEEDLFKDIGFTVAELHGFRFPDTKDRIIRMKEKIRSKYPVEVVNFDWG